MENGKTTARNKPQSQDLRVRDTDKSAINRTTTLRAEPRGQPGAQVSGGHLGIDVWKCVMRSRRRGLDSGRGLLVPEEHLI